MVPKRIRTLRILVMVTLALLLLQYEFGMAVNLSVLPTLAPFGLSLGAVSSALNQAGVAAVIHASLGAWLALFALADLILALASRVRSVQVFGALAFVAVLLAAYCGLYFVLSGYQNDGLSHGMATNFLLSFIFYFLELYFLKPAPKTGTA